MVDEFYAVLGMAYGAEPEIFGFSHPSVLINCRFHEGCIITLSMDPIRPLLHDW